MGRTIIGKSFDERTPFKVLPRGFKHNALLEVSQDFYSGSELKVYCVTKMQCNVPKITFFQKGEDCLVSHSQS